MAGWPLTRWLHVAGNFSTDARRHGWIGFFAGAVSVLGYLSFLAAAKLLPLGPVVALRETSVIFGSLIGTFVLKEAFGLRRITASALVISGIAVVALTVC